MSAAGSWMCLHRIATIHTVVELFDTEVDSIRTFDHGHTAIRRSISKSVSIYPCSQIPSGDTQLFAEAEKRIYVQLMRNRSESAGKERTRNGRLSPSAETEGRAAAGICREHDQYSVSGKIPPVISTIKTMYIWDYMT